MNKAELVSAMAERASITKTDAESMLNSFQDIVRDVLRKGETLTLVGFGTFKTGQRKATTGVNPRTKEKIAIPAKTVAKFKFSDGVNELLK